MLAFNHFFHTCYPCIDNLLVFLNLNHYEYFLGGSLSPQSSPATAPAPGLNSSVHEPSQAPGVAPSLGNAVSALLPISLLVCLLAVFWGLWGRPGSILRVGRSWHMRGYFDVFWLIPFELFPFYLWLQGRYNSLCDIDILAINLALLLYVDCDIDMGVFPPRIGCFWFLCCFFFFCFVPFCFRHITKKNI